MLKHFAIDAEGVGLNFQAGQIGHSAANGSQPQRRFFEAALPRRLAENRALPLATTFRYNNEFNETSIIKIRFD